MAFKNPAVLLDRPAPSSRAPSTLGELRRTIDRAAHLLPAQGPISVFIHHNTLHAFEELPFEEAVVKGGKVFGCQPFLSEHRYRQELIRGRIRSDELRDCLREDLGEGADDPIPPHGTRLDLRLAMLLYPLRSGPAEELRWFVAETDALRQIRADASAAARERLVAETRRWVLRDLRSGLELGRLDEAPRTFHRASSGLSGLIEKFGESRIEEWSQDTWEAFTLQALWRVCQLQSDRCSPPPPPQTTAHIRHRDLLLEATGEDADRPVHELLIRFTAAYLDQGLGHWQLPLRDEGFFRAFCALYGPRGAEVEPWRRGLAAELTRLAEVDPLESIGESLDLLGVPAGEWEEFIAATLLVLRGWAGITRFIEERGDRAVHPVPPGSLVGFLAVRLVLDRLAIVYTARKALGYRGELARLRCELRRRLACPEPVSVEQRAFPVFKLAQVLGWTPEELHRLGRAEWEKLTAEIDAFSRVQRRRVFHLAYERRFCIQALDAVALHARDPVPEPKKPRFQAVFCLDEREESIRRHLEEVAPDCQTFGIAGFYLVAMYYRGADDAHFVPLCPAVMQPGHWVVERVADDLEDSHRLRTRVRRALGKATHQVHVGSRGLTVGALLSTALGVVASIPLVARTLAPRLTARIREALGRVVRTPRQTVLQIERTDPSPGPENGHVGYTLDEMTGIAERVLRDIGLTANFARLVLTFGHGSTSMNNPHESAHDCGACGGARGGPNGRAIARILNDPRVRAGLAARAIVIPETTVFVGGMHNTSSEAATFYDLDLVPESHRAEFEAARRNVEEACDRNAHERARRFDSLPLTASLQAARQHVEGRAEDLSQVRPEWGHATNAICIVGRRARTRGLFLDRRAFLTSYDPTRDDSESSVLARILAAAVPVCAGINLEYYFSYVDNTGYGCGSKLPHNITSLVGVMDGAASDLRTGLPWQMVEIHEPVRLLFVVETTPERMLAIMDRNPVIGRLVRNRWVKLAVLDPDSPAVRVFADGRFGPYKPSVPHLPRSGRSADWYRGWRDHLEFATIVPPTDEDR